MSGGQEAYYANLAREDYYLEGGEPPGVWFGRGAEALGLGGVVEKATLSDALGGMGPKGERLAQAQRYGDGRARQPGWDLTFSAPKSVSVLWSQADGATRRAIQDAHAAAVKEALSYLEDVAANSRRGHGGATVDRAGLLVALFEHGTSRAQDPQLHTHALVVNAGLRSDGTWGTLRSRDLFLHKMVAGALYRAELGHRLVSELGVRLVKERTWFEIARIPKPLIEEFSKRREQIEEALAKFGWAGANASELVSRSTRERKGHVSRDELFQEWQAIGSKLGWAEKDLKRAVGRRATPRISDADLTSEVENAVTRIVKAESHFGEKDVLRKVAEELQAGGVSVRAIREAVRGVLGNDPSLVALGEVRGFKQYTTRELLECEARITALATSTRDSRRHVLSDRKVAAALEVNEELNGEQKEALKYLLGTPGAIQCVSGMAGTGKTRLMEAADGAWTKAGFDVIGLSVAARAAKNLEKGSGITSETVARFLTRLGLWTFEGRDDAENSEKKPQKAELSRAKLGKNSIVVLDEAGMLGTRDFEKVVAAVLEQGGKVVLLGDDRQLASIDAGAPFRAVKKLVDGRELTEIVRQKEEWMRDAVQQFAEGDARAALTQYALAERLHVTETRGAAMTALLEHWKRHKDSSVSDNLILAGTNAEVDQLNRMAQLMRFEEGELGGSDGVRFGGGLLFPGDQVLFTKNMKAHGYMNGDTGTVVSTSRGHLARSSATIRIEGDERPTYVTVALEDDLPMRLGYATTVHKAQGSTVKQAWVLTGAWMNDRETAYVQMSRSEDATHIFTSEGDAGEDLAELAHAMSQSRAKLQAHELLTDGSRLGMSL